MAVQIYFPIDDSSFFEHMNVTCVSAFLFGSGALAAYALSNYFPTMSETGNHSYVDLSDQITDLKFDIRRLKGEFAAAWAQFAPEVGDIQHIISHPKLSGSNSVGDVQMQLENADKAHSQWGFRGSRDASIPRGTQYQSTPRDTQFLSPPRETQYENTPRGSQYQSTPRGSQYPNRDSKSVFQTNTGKSQFVNTANKSVFRDTASANQFQSKAKTQFQNPSTTSALRASFDSDDDEEYLSATNFMAASEDDLKEAMVLRPVLDEVDVLCLGSETDKEKAMVLLRQKEETHPTYWELKWRLARGHLSLYGASEEHDIKRMHAITALKYAQDALNMKQTSADVHKWYAVSLAANLDFQSLEQRNANSALVKKHLDRAIELDPLEPMPHFIRGKWCWGLYKLKWIEKKLTGALYGAPPHVSIEEIIDSFMKAEDLAPGFYKANRLFLGKCYLEKKDYESADNWLTAALALPINTKEDARTQDVLHNLMKHMKI